MKGKQKLKTKTCNKCKRTLPIQSYYFHKGSTKDGFKNTCKECRGFKFGQTKYQKPRCFFWTDEKNKLLSSLYACTDNDTLANKFNTTVGAINAQAISLGLKKNLWWSNNEIEILKENYSTMSNERIIKKFKFNRSLGSLRKKAFELGITKNESVLVEIGRKNIKKAIKHNFQGTKGVRHMCRNRLGNWTKAVSDYYNNECATSNQKSDLVVHHIKPFREIFYETYK